MPLSFADFDVEITRVLLAHRYTIHPGSEMDAYRQGRNMHGMVCPVSGCGEYFFVGGGVARLRPGEIALIPASSAYRMRAADDRPFDHYTVNFLGGEDTLPKWVPRDSMYILRPKDAALFQVRFEEIVEIWKRMRVGCRMRAKASLLTLLADYLSESAAQSVDPGAYNRTLPAKRMIEARYAEPLTLSRLAEACGMTENSFRRAFTAVYSQPPIAYLLKLRIEKAKELLLIGASLEETALRTGFSDVNYFIRCFRKTAGITPGRFRQMY